MDLLQYDCITAAGDGPATLLNALNSGSDLSCIVRPDQWSRAVAGGGRVCFLPNISFLDRNYQNELNEHIEKIWNRIYLKNSAVEKSGLKSAKALVIFSSTKGFIEDFIWTHKGHPEGVRTIPDPFQAVVQKFKTDNEKYFSILDCLVVSNACASSHIAIEMAEAAIESLSYDYVIVICADLIGPFIYQGFQSLKVLSGSRNQPFGQNRDGLQLGEAVAILVFGKPSKAPGSVKIKAISSETEGGSVTRPSENGESLLRAMKSMVEKMDSKTPDFFMAHGTGTRFNDASEELAIRKFSSFLKISKPVMGIKWCVGHTLGASGALDLIVSSEVLKAQKLFKIHNTTQIDSAFESAVLTYDSQMNNENKISCAVVNSLGFGGVHAALFLEVSP